MPPLLKVSGLKTHFFTFRGTLVVKAVDGVDFTLEEGETMGLVGESGCGKTTTRLSLVQLLPPAGRIVDGSIEFQGDDLVPKSMNEMRTIRGNRIAMILQDPMASLNPRYTQVGEPAYFHQSLRGRALRDRVRNLLVQSGFPHRKPG